MSAIDMKPYYDGKGAEMTTHTVERRQMWRQIGWIGLASNEAYSLLDPRPKEDPAGYGPIWILVENETPPLPEGVS